jgi:hypothetical protein
MPMMKCGHAANGTTHSGKPCCVICAGIHPGADVVVDEPDLTGRVAKCSDCGCEVKSDMGLPFFEYRPTRKFDVFYCGCRGFE